MIGSDDSDDVVISGISGVFPNSENVQEFKENLLAGNDMISASTRPYSKGEYTSNCKPFMKKFHIT